VDLSFRKFLTVLPPTHIAGDSFMATEPILRPLLLLAVSQVPTVLTAPTLAIPAS